MDPNNSDKTTNTVASKSQQYGMFIKGMLMDKSKFKPSTSDETFYTLHVGIPGNREPIDVRVTPERWDRAEIMQVYEKKVEYTVSRKNNQHYFSEAL